MKDNLVSIIIPIYKVEKYLKVCLDSVINQTYKNLEIILVDDGSPDNCPKICDEYALKDNRIKVIHQKNSGLSSARNAGLDICKGKYVSFIDSDDLISLDFIKELFELIDKYDCDIAQCDFLRFKDNDNVYEKSKLNIDNEVTLLNTIDAHKNLLNRGCMGYVIVCNKLYKREIYDNIRFPIGRLHEDEFCTYKAFDNAKNGICVTNKIMYFYRNNESSITNYFSVDRYDAIIAYEEKVDFYKNKGNEELYYLSILKVNDLLKDLYKKTYYYITEEKQKNLRYIKNKLKENYIRIKKCSKTTFKQRFIKGLICNFPLLYTKLFNNK